jgi:hypothetical protein
VADDKKKPSRLAPTWHFSMKAGFCSFPMCAEHGHREDTPLSCIIATDEIGFPRSRLSRFRPNTGVWGCTTICRREISRPLM